MALVKLLASRHNLQYWRNQPYLGFGAGAHGSAEKLRVANARHDLQQYIAPVSDKARWIDSRWGRRLRM